MSVDEFLRDVLRAVDRRGDLELSTKMIEDALDKLAKSRVRLPDLRRVAAGDPRTRSKTLDRLARSADDEVRRSVAGNPQVPSDVLRALASDPEFAVRAAAAGNGTIDGLLLARLAHDEEPESVRAPRAIRCLIHRY